MFLNDPFLVLTFLLSYEHQDQMKVTLGFILLFFGGLLRLKTELTTFRTNLFVSANKLGL